MKLILSLLIVLLVIPMAVIPTASARDGDDIGEPQNLISDIFFWWVRYAQIPDGLNTFMTWLFSPDSQTNGAQLLINNEGSYVLSDWDSCG